MENKFKVGDRVYLKSKNGMMSKSASDVEIGETYAVNLIDERDIVRLLESGMASWVNVEDLELVEFESEDYHGSQLHADEINAVFAKIGKIGKIGNVIHNNRPPLGVIPRKYHREERINELTRAIREYVIHDLEGNVEIISEWVEELNGWLWDIKCEAEMKNRGE